MTSTAISHEQEAKFRVTELAVCQAFLSGLTDQGYTSADLGESDERDTYLDTPAFDLVRRGLVVRLRRAGDRITLGVKGLAADRSALIQDRVDIAVPLPPDTAMTQYATWPAAIAAAIAPLLPPGAHPTTPIAHVHQVRQRRRIGPPGADQPVAEWSLDDVTVVAPGPRGDLQPAATFMELELERLPAGDMEQFNRLLACAPIGAGLEPLTDSKLERALLSFPGEGAGVTPQMDVAEACRRILYQQYIALLVLEHAVRRGDDPEPVHDMRVAIRRARAAIHLFAAYFRKGALRPHVTGLRRLGRALGAVRDLDVALANLARFRKQQPRDQRKGFKLLRGQMEAERARACVALLDHLDSQTYRDWLIDFAQFCQTPGHGVRKVAVHDHEIPPRQVRHTFPGVILGCFLAVRAYEDAFAQADLPALDTFHSLRITCKYLRYSLEFTRHLLGAPGEAIIAQLKLLQDHLGELNDARVELERLAAWTLKRPKTDAIAARRAALEASVTTLTTTFPPLYAHFVAVENRTLLGAALAQL